MRMSVDEEVCTGCGECQDICPDVFEFDGGVAKVKEDPVAPEHEEAALAALESCPVDAISEVED